MTLADARTRSMKSELNQADIDAARRRFPEAFRAPLKVRLARWSTAAVGLAILGWCLYAFDASPARIWNGLGRLGHVLSLMFPPSLDPVLLLEGVEKIGETVAMSVLGTILAGLIALPLGFLGARFVMPSEFFRVGVRRGFDILRAFEQLVIALILIRAFGLGPFAGILAIAISDIGTVGKIFAEAIENISRRPVEGLTAAGAGRIQTIRYAIVPQVLPVLVSNLLYQFESNTRSATILGIVGAGGIGFLLVERIRGFHWADVTTLVIMLIITVALVDLISARLRRAIIGTDTAVT
jgi:phosphonate transport system permease protein